MKYLNRNVGSLKKPKNQNSSYLSTKKTQHLFDLECFSLM